MKQRNFAIMLLAAATLISACADDQLPESPVAPQTSAQSGSFPMVIVRSGPGADRSTAAGAPVVDNFVDALARVTPGGTIRVQAGTYSVADVLIDKPVTIQAFGKDRPLIRTAGFDGFRITGVTSGTVKFTGLDFETAHDARAGIAARVAYDVVIVEDCTFNVASVGGVTATTAVEFATSPAGHGIVRNSRVTGGRLAVFSYGTRADISNSTFGGHTFGGIQYQSDGRGTVENNEINGCGFLGCARVFQSEVDIVNNRFAESRTDVDPFRHNLIFYSNASSGTIADNHFDGCGLGQCVTVVMNSVVEIVRNEFTIPAAHNTRFVIAGSDGTVGAAPNFGSRAPTLLIADNTIRGVGGTASATPGDPNAYAIKFGGILLENAAVGRIYRNHVENAQHGIIVSEAGSATVGRDGGNLVDGSDNSFTLVHTGVRSRGSSGVNLRSSDFTSYYSAFQLWGSDPQNVQCNWWGSAAGPSNFGAPSASVYTPWATSPVKGSSVTTC